MAYMPDKDGNNIYGRNRFPHQDGDRRFHSLNPLRLSHPEWIMRRMPGKADRDGKTGWETLNLKSREPNAKGLVF